MRNKNSYADQIRGIYGKLNSNDKYEYDPNNDEAYKQYASQYRALQGLANQQNKQIANDLTGGYGSTYSDIVADQNQLRSEADLQAAQPQYALVDQDIWQGKKDMLRDMYGASAQMRDNELDALKQAGNIAIAQDEIDLANRERDYQKALEEQQKQNAQAKFYQDWMNILGDKEAKRRAEEEKLRLQMQKEAEKQARAKSKGSRSRKKKYSNDDYPLKDSKSAESEKKAYTNSFGTDLSEVLALGYGPINDDKLVDLVSDGEVIAYKDSNGNMHLKRNLNKFDKGTGAKNKQNFPKVSIDVQRALNRLK